MSLIAHMSLRMSLFKWYAVENKLNVANVNCRESEQYPSGLGAKLRYMGYFASLLHPPGRKTWLLFSVRVMSWGLRNPCFTKFSVVNFL